MNAISWQQSVLSAGITLVIGGLFVALVIRWEGRARSGYRSRGLPNQVARRVNAVRLAVDADDWEATAVALRHIADELDRAAARAKETIGARRSTRRIH
jgi:hypothetical protein